MRRATTREAELARPRRMIRPHLAPLLALASLAGCDLGPDDPGHKPEIPAAYRATAESEQAAWPSADWWRGFKSPELNDLIEQARAQNFDIQAAIARVRQADAQVRIAGAALLPTLSANGNGQYQRLGNTGGSSFTSFTNTAASSAAAAAASATGAASAAATPTTTVLSTGASRYTDVRTYTAELQVSYEVDFWGKNAAAREASVASDAFSRFDQVTTALTVVTNVANTWFSALAFKDRLAIAEQDLEDARQTLKVIQARFAVGTANALDIAQEETQVAIQRAAIPNLRSQMEQQVIALGILVGRPPEAVTVTPTSLEALDLPPVCAGLPSELLARRPDVASAEAQLVSADASIRQARAAFLPSVTLTVDGGHESAALATLFGPGSLILSVAGGLAQPIFDGGTLRGNLEQARGRRAELLADYRKAVVQAFTDVDTALTAYRYATEQEDLQRTATVAARRALDIAQAQVAAGTVDVTTVLTQQTTLYNAQDTLAQVRLARFQALLNLYKALGGGWTQPGPIADQFPGLSPGLLPGGLALPVGDAAR
jgi:NodT family efflux transporter outer membrane factor (OMF) lipoprotein